MRLFQPKHTVRSVAETICRGLQTGEVVLTKPPLGRIRTVRIAGQMTEEGPPEQYTPGRWERLTAMNTAAVAIFSVVYLVIRNEPFADPYLAALARKLLFFAAAVLGATIPGFLKIGLSIRGLSVRAAGALVLFVLAFAFTPHILGPTATASFMIIVDSVEFGAGSHWFDYTDQIAAECDDKNRCAPTLVLNPSDRRFPESVGALNKALIIKYSCDKGGAQNLRIDVAEEGPVPIQIICDN